MKTHFGPFEFDLSNQLLWRGGEAVPLPPRVVGVLGLLVARPGEVVSRQELIESVWKDAFVSDTSLAEAVSFLRQALGDDPQQPSYIQTVHRRGYRFLPTATPIAPAISPESTADGVAVAERPDRWSHIVPWSIVVLLGVIAASALWRLAHPDAPAPVPVARFDVALPEGTTLDSSAPAIAFSPAGERLAFAACAVDGCRVLVRALDELEPRVVAGTAGGVSPFFSPDGQSIGFFADGKLKIVPVSGGSPTTLADARGAFGGVWLADGTIAFAGSLVGGLQRVSSSGSEPRAKVDVDPRGGELRYESPESVPGSPVVLVTAVMAASAPSLDRIVAISLETGEHTPIVARGSAPRFIAPNVLTFVRDGDLMAAAFDSSQLKIVSAPVVVIPRLGEHPSQYAVSRLGSVALGSRNADASPSLAWVAADGVVTPLPDAVQPMVAPDLSPDGRRIVASRPDGDRADLWWADAERGTLSRLTSDGVHRDARWTPDGRTIAFATGAHGTFNLFVRPVADNAALRRLTESAHHQVPGAISPDNAVLFTDFDPTTGADIWRVAAGDGATAVPVVRTAFDESAPALSPDGRWLAYQANESNRWEIYVRPFPSGGAAVPISAGGGTSPVWSRDGRTLYYAGRDGVLSVGVSCTAKAPSSQIALHDCPELTPAAPVRIASGPWIPRGAAPDGRLLVERDRRGVGVNRISVTLQWSRELQRLIPPAVVSSPK